MKHSFPEKSQLPSANGHKDSWATLPHNVLGAAVLVPQVGIVGIKSTIDKRLHQDVRGQA